MAYTASALSLMLRGFGKPIVLTGSQLPLAAPRTDARQNLLGARTLLLMVSSWVPASVPFLYASMAQLLPKPKIVSLERASHADKASWERTVASQTANYGFG